MFLLRALLFLFFFFFLSSAAISLSIGTHTIVAHLATEKSIVGTHCRKCPINTDPFACSFATRASRPVDTSSVARTLFVIPFSILFRGKQDHGNPAFQVCHRELVQKFGKNS